VLLCEVIRRWCASLADPHIIPACRSVSVVVGDASVTLLRDEVLGQDHRLISCIGIGTNGYWHRADEGAQKKDDAKSSEHIDGKFLGDRQETRKKNSG